jgi:tetratricopeptide (TPR) repeat protein
MGPLALLQLVALLCLCRLPAQADSSPAALDSEQAAVAAYRADDLETARTLWLEALDSGADTLAAAERGRLCYNLGKVASRRGDSLEAVGWYTAALRLRPRDEDSWANLELERLNAGLGAADRGDLAATVERLLSSLTEPESSWLALFGLLPLALCLGFEALRGGRRWRWLSLFALGLALLCGLPWARHRLAAGSDPVLVLAEDRVPLRSEPRKDAERIGELAAGAIVDRRDALPEWTEVEFEGHRRGWLRGSAVFALRR